MTKTLKLYYKYPDRNQFDATIIHVNGKGVILDKTLFYPKGGYQDADHGILNMSGTRLPVSDVIENNGEIIHFVSDTSMLREGSTVHGLVDFDRRFYLSLLHTAQHVISRIIFNKWKINTNRSNFIDSGGEIVLSKPIVEKDLYFIEEKLMEVASEKRNVLCHMEDDFRLVDIAGYDCSPCGGTHLTDTSYLENVYLIGVDGNKILYDGGKVGFNRLKACRKEMFYIKNKLGKPDNCLKIIDNLNENLNIYKYNYNMLSIEMLKQQFNDPGQHKKVDGFRIGIINNRLINTRNLKAKFFKRIFPKLKKESKFDLYIIISGIQTTLLSFSNLVSCSDIIATLKKEGFVQLGGGNHKKANFIMKDISCEAMVEKIGEFIQKINVIQ